MTLYAVPELPADDYLPDTWQQYAACKGMDPALFFPERGEDTAQAKAVCRACPVANYCRDWAVHNFEHHGIWGGTSERERRKIRVTEGIAWNRDAQREHGTDAGYQQHRRAGTEPCLACKVARSIYKNRLRRVPR